MRRGDRSRIQGRGKRVSSVSVQDVQINGAIPVDSRHPAPYHPRSSPAQVAELVDALASGASSRKGVEVRVFSWAPSFNG